MLSQWGEGGSENADIKMANHVAGHENPCGENAVHDMKIQHKVYSIKIFFSRYFKTVFIK